MKYPHLAARLFNTPLMVHPAKLDAIIAGLGPRLLGVDALEGLQALRPEMFSTRRGPRSERGYRVVDGVAVISAMGALVHRTRLDADSTSLLGYNDIAADMEDAMANPNVHAIAQVWDSPGGESSGAFELADRLLAMRGRKPVIAVVDCMAASGAYLAASAADEVVINSVGYAGSIGVVARHVDFSHALQNDGIKVTSIFAGDHKVDGNPYEPLPPAVRADIQADIDGIYDQFIAAVAAHRRMDAQAVRKTQAQTYRGVAAIAAGLADRIGTTDQVISELAARRPRIHPAGQSARSNAKGASMSDTNPGGNQPAATPAADPGAAALEQARAEGRAAGVQAERERAAAILGHERAASHTALAHQCIASGLSAEQSAAILAAAPSVAPPQPAANAFIAAMGALPNPAVSGIEPAGDGGNEASALAAQVLKSFGISAAASA